MTVSDICKSIDASVVCGDVNKQFEGVYVGDLLSRAMSKVETDCIWVTIMSNVNVVAVATLTEPAAIVLAEDVVLQDDALTAARDNGLTVLSSPLSAFEICVAIARFCEEMET
jgi:predicted transcriptional regulator